MSAETKSGRRRGTSARTSLPKSGIVICDKGAASSGSGSERWAYWDIGEAMNVKKRPMVEGIE
jgi:hypothetical protein